METQGMTIAQAARAAARRKTLPAQTYSCWMTEIDRGAVAHKPGRKGKHARKRLEKYVTSYRHNLTTDTASGYTNRRDWQAKSMGMGASMAFATITGNLTSISAIVATNSGAAFTTAGQGLAGCMVVVSRNSSGTGSTAYGRIVSNTATALTVDQWWDPTSSTGAAATTPNGTGAYIVLPGQYPAEMLAVTSNATTSAASDTTLTSEATTNGFARAVGTYSHTAAASTYALTKTFTASGSLTVNKGAVFGAINSTGGGVMPFESDEPTPPAMLSGDTLAQTVTITIN